MTRIERKAIKAYDDVLSITEFHIELTLSSEHEPSIWIFTKESCCHLTFYDFYTKEQEDKVIEVLRRVVKDADITAQEIEVALAEAMDVGRSND